MATSMFDGRVRRSTVILAAVFLLTLVTYLMIRPNPAIILRTRPAASPSPSVAPSAVVSPIPESPSRSATPGPASPSAATSSRSATVPTPPSGRPAGSPSPAE